MISSTDSANIDNYIELASPQLLDDKWRELSFDLASGQNIIQDCSNPEFGSGYVYRDAKSVGTATHNRFIYWRTANDLLELIEMSTEINLEDNQVRIRFVNSPIINNVNVIELPESIVIIFATITSVHRILLPHPKTTNRSIFSDLTSDVLFDPANYYLLSHQGSSGSNRPICSSSWLDRSMVKCAISFPDSSILIVQFGFQTHLITTSEIKQSGIIGRLWSKMPNLWAKNPDECDNAIFASAPMMLPDSDDVLLVTLCRDCRVRIFSIATKECVCSFNMIPQSSFHQSFAAHTNPSTEIPVMKILGSYIVIYLSEFVFLKYRNTENGHELAEHLTLLAPDHNKLLDFGLSKENGNPNQIWALVDSCDTGSALHHLSIKKLFDSENNESGPWKVVNLLDMNDPSGFPNIIGEIFWKNRFSFATVKKALTLIAGSPIPARNNMESLEEIAKSKIVGDDREEKWKRFYEFCVQNHMRANKCIGLILSEDETIIGTVKRSNPSFICPLQGSSKADGVYRCIRYPECSLDLVNSLDRLSSELLHEDELNCLDEKLVNSPTEILAAIEEITQTIHRNHPDFPLANDNSLLVSIDHFCDELDLSEEAKSFNTTILHEHTNKMKSEHSPLGSTSGIMTSIELFRCLVRDRKNLARDLLIYTNLLTKYQMIEKTSPFSFSVLYTSGRIKRLLNLLRSYATLAWLADSPITNLSHQNVNFIDHISKDFQFFKKAKGPSLGPWTMLDQLLHQNLLMYFLTEGGVNFHWQLSQITNEQQTLSSSYYMTQTVINLCKLLWPQPHYLCMEEFMFTHQLDRHLTRYLTLIQGWVGCCESDRHFISACNKMLQNKAGEAVDIFERLWTDIYHSNYLGRFLQLDHQDQHERVNADSRLIDSYYDKLIQLFQIYGNKQSLVRLINNCMSLLGSCTDEVQTLSMNSLRAKLFQYYLELEETDEAYHTMVLTTDPSLRVNCLRKFIVSHCEQKQWINLLSYPFIDIKHEFIDILNQKAESLDLSSLESNNFHDTTYYDLLFASHVMDEDFQQAAEVMYRYSQRLALEVPGMISIRKQVDCLLVALNSIRSIEGKDQYIEHRKSTCNVRTSMLKRSHDAESGQSTQQVIITGDSKVSCIEMKKKYELTKARLRLLEKDLIANTIALSPLEPEEVIGHLVESSLFSSAMDLASLFNTSVEPILEGLTSKFILVMRLSRVDISAYENVEVGLMDIFSDMATYNYVANSTISLADKLWYIIYHYMITYDGVHRYSARTTVLMRVVANKLLSAGFHVPASLRQLYLSRNPSELLKLMIKYDNLKEAAELSIEMIDRILEPANALITPASKVPSPVYLPTHLINLLISFLNEDATDTSQLKIAAVLTDRLDRFRRFVQSN